MTRQTHIIWRILYVVTLMFGFLSSKSFAGYHSRGTTTISIGGSISHTQFYFGPEDTDIYGDPAADYMDIDGSLYLSTGYFLVDRVEIGLSGSGMMTTYPGEEQSDLTLYDAQLYAKYYFDNESSCTPYLGIQGGYTTVEMDTYQESNMSGGTKLGMSFMGMGVTSWYIEYTSEYTFNQGDAMGTEWENQVYVGISFYLSLFQKREENIIIQETPQESDTTPSTSPLPSPSPSVRPEPSES